MDNTELSARCAAVAELGTGPVSDAMEELALPRSVIVGWHFVTSHPRRALVGPCYTLRQAKKSRAAPHSENLTRQREASAHFASAGEVIVIDAGDRTDICTWGENQALMAKSRGVAGLVAFGAIRDSEAIRRSGFPALCRGFSPVASRWDVETVAMNEPVTLNGVHVRPGDVIYGDADGVLVIPREHALAVFEQASAIAAREAKRQAELFGSEPALEQA